MSQDDIVIFCGADAFSGRILHDLLNIHEETRIKSIHQYRVENAFYDRGSGTYLMHKKSPMFYAEAFAHLHRIECYDFMSFCRYDVELMAAVVEILKDKYKIYARVYFLPDKLGWSERRRSFVFNSPESGDNG